MADRLTFCTNSYHTYTLEECLAGAAAAGSTRPQQRSESSVLEARVEAQQEGSPVESRSACGCAARRAAVRSADLRHAHALPAYHVALRRTRRGPHLWKAARCRDRYSRCEGAAEDRTVVGEKCVDATQRIGRLDHHLQPRGAGSPPGCAPRGRGASANQLLGHMERGPRDPALAVSMDGRRLAAEIRAGDSLGEPAPHPPSPWPQLPAPRTDQA